MNKEVSISFEEEYIITEDESGKTEVKIVQVEKVIEIDEYYFIRLKSNMTFIIPKRVIEDKMKFNAYFEKHSINWDYQLNWQWK